MAWYDKGKVPEWRSLVDRPYSSEALLASKDLLLSELPKAEQLQAFIRNHRNPILTDLLRFCLQPASDSSTYDQKYTHPTRAIELMTHEVFFGALSLDGEGARQYIQLLIEFFLSVDPHKNNINLHHAYFERLLRMLIGCRTFERAVLGAAFEQEQTKTSFLEKLFKHAHKLSICCSLEILLTLDLVEPSVIFSLLFKQKILQLALQCLAEYLREAADPEKAENCLQMIKVLLERGINFLASKRNLHETQQTIEKTNNFFQLYSHFQANFNLIIGLITSNTESCIKVVSFQLLQLNQILLSQPQLKQRQLPADWGLFQSQSILAYMFGTKMGIVHPAFIDWLTISFAQIGHQQAQVDLLIRQKVLQTVIGMMLSNRNNNILNAKIFQLLKIIFHNIAEIQVISCIQKHKAPTSVPPPTSFKLLAYFLQCLGTLESAVRQFRSINEPLFVTLFTLFKIVSQYCRNIDSIFNLYAHLQICKATRPAITKVIDFQRQEQCFMVFQREISKDLGKFYTDDMFISQKPIEFTVKPLTALHPPVTFQLTSPFQAQTLIKIPNPPSALPHSTPPQEKKSQIVIPLEGKAQKHIAESETIDPPSIKIPLVSQAQNEEEQTSGPSSKFGSYMRQRLKQVETNIQQRKSKSKTPTKIKSETKKNKKWTNNDEPEEKAAFSSEVKERPRSISTPKLTRALIQCKAEKVAFIKVPKYRIPHPAKERLVTAERDGRLLGWIAALRA